MTTTPTQIAYPWKATLRTILAVAAGIILGLSSTISVLAVFAPQFLDAVKDVLPASWLPTAVAIVASIVAISGAVTRVMAIPGVNDFLTKLKLGAAPTIDASVVIAAKEANRADVEYRTPSQIHADEQAALARAGKGPTDSL